MTTAVLTRALHRLAALTPAEPVAAVEVRSALAAVRAVLDLAPMPEAPSRAPVDLCAAIFDLARIVSAANAVADPERRAAAVACAAWLTALLRPEVLRAAGWRRSTTRPDAWIDPYAPEDLHSEASAWSCVERDELAARDASARAAKGP